jgi:glutamate racemase
MKGAIGVFDSGYGGLTILKSLQDALPEYNFIYLGDNARTPYGNRSFETVYQYTLQNTVKLFEMGCPLVILACNTASAKALRTIQQKDLPKAYPDKKVLGVIRPTTEIVDKLTKNKCVGILGTKGTVQSNSYVLEINKFFPEIKVFQQACPMWVPIIENGEANSNGADYFVKKYLDELLEQNENIDTIILACTHYPLLLQKIKSYLSPQIRVIAQGNIVAESLKDYLQRHKEIDEKISKNGINEYFTTDDTLTFDAAAEIFLEKKIKSNHASI